MGEVEDKFIITPDYYRLNNKIIKERGGIKNTMVTREPNGDISGLTETVYYQNKPDFVEQWMTGVDMNYR